MGVCVCACVCLRYIYADIVVERNISGKGQVKFIQTKRNETNSIEMTQDQGRRTQWGGGGVGARGRGRGNAMPE